MSRRPLANLLRAAADAAFGLMVFVALLAIASGSPEATLFEPWRMASVGAFVPILILAAVFSMIVAFNLAFYRHLRRVYASPRQGAWRRSR